MKDEMQSSRDTQASSFADRGLSPRDARPAFGTKRSMQSDYTTTEDYASARSSPLTLDDANRVVQSPTSDDEGSATRLASGKQQQLTNASAEGDLLDTLLRGLSAVECQHRGEDQREDQCCSGSSADAFDIVGSGRCFIIFYEGSDTCRHTVHRNRCRSEDIARNGAAGVAAAAVGAAIVGTGAGVVSSRVGAAAAAAAIHQKQPSFGSELSNSRDTSSRSRSAPAL